jgi:hypothetical protein
MGVAVYFDDDNATVEAVPGTQASCSIRVENTGMVVDSMLLDLLGDAAEWASVEPAQMNLLPGASAQARILFSPPRVATLEPGDVPFGLRAMSMEDPNGSRIEEGVIRVGEFSDVGAELVPKSATGRRSAHYKLVVENRGNRPEDLAVDAVDPDVKLAFHTRPQLFTAAPGTATFIRLTAVPRKTFFKGPSKTLPFQVSAQPEQGDAAQADGVMLEKQTLPEWLLPLLGIAVLLAGLIFALWYTVLRPVVHSADTAATAAQTAANSAKSAAKSAKSAANSASAAAKSHSKPPSALDVTLPDPTILSHTTELASVTGSFAKGVGTLPPVVWTSSAPKIAKVSQTGVVTGMGPGSATITATAVSNKPSQTASTTAAVRPVTRFGSLAVLTAAVTPAASSSPILSASATLNVVAPVKVSTAALAEAPVGKLYSASLNASGGTGAFTWSVTAGSLPADLSVTPGSGTISGTPNKLGTYSFTVHVADAGPPTQFATKVLTLRVVNALAVNTSSLPSGTVGAAYSQTLSAVGGTSPYTWSIVPGSGSLPAGLSLSPSSGLISGTPTTSGLANFVVQASDASSPSQSISQPLSINVVTPLTLAAVTLPGGTEGSAYFQTLTATGGTQPYTWSVTAGSPPAGMMLSSTSGAVTGSPTATGTFKFTVQVTDASKPAQTQTESLTLTIVNQLAVNTSSLPGVTVGAPYSQSLAAVGGTAPYTWSLVPGSGSLPAGLSLNPSTGAITGTPTSAGSSTFSIQVTDSSSPSLSATKSLTVKVVSPLTLSALTLPGAVQGTAYSQTLTATGGTQPFTWSVTAGSPPAGLTLNPTTGTLSGTPKATGSSTFTVQITDSSQPAGSVSQTFSIVVVKAFLGTVSSLPQAAVGAHYAATLTATGGTAPYTWTALGTLPPGLTLLPGGQITGIPAGTGIYPFSVQAVDSSSPPLSVTIPLTITIVSPLKITTTTLQEAAIGSNYSQTLVASGGSQPYTWSLQPGSSLPPGLSLNSSTGTISGAPDPALGEDSDFALPFTYSFTVLLTDSVSPNPLTTTMPMQITVVNPVQFSLPEPEPNAVAGGDYVGVVPTATGGSGSYLWSFTGSEPPGLALAVTPTTGQLTGTVGASASPGTYTFTLTVADENDPSLTASQQVSITLPQLQVSTAATSLTATVGTALDQSLSGDVTGGNPPYTFSLASSSASWLSLSSAGVLSGTPDAPCPNPSTTENGGEVEVECATSTDTAQVTVTDADGHTQTVTLSLTVSVPPLFLNPTNTGGQVGDSSAYLHPVLTAAPSGGYPSGTYTYSTTGVNSSGYASNNGLPCYYISPFCSDGQLSISNGANNIGSISGTIGELPVIGTTYTYDVDVSEQDPAEPDSPSYAITYSFQLTTTVEASSTND